MALFSRVRIRAWLYSRTMVEEQMRRTKQWWSALTQQERSELWWYEHSERRSGRSGYIPDDCVECGYCGTPHLGYGLCPPCLNRLISLINKADTACRKE